MTATKTICSRLSPRQTDVAMLLEVVATVDPGCVVELLGDVSEAWLKDTDLVKPTPAQMVRSIAMETTRPGVAVTCKSEGTRSGPAIGKRAVDQPVAIEQELPGQTDRGSNHSRRARVQRPEEVIRHPAVDDDRQADRQEDQDRRDEQDE